MKLRFSIKAKKQKASTAGFVLPYVLLVIAILSVTTIIVAERLQKLTHSMASIQGQFETEQALLNAEAEAIYVILTGKPHELALDVNPLTPYRNPFIADLNSEPENDEIVADLWSVLRGQRIANQYDLPVLVSLQDASGLVSVNESSSEQLERLLIANGVQPNKAEILIARLQDYLDLDNRRRFKGAERSDYRLRRMDAPSNSPIRNFDELSNVLGWNEVLDDINLHDLMDMVTLQPGDVVAQAFATPNLLKIIDLDRNPSLSSGIDADIGNLLLNNKRLSGVYRLVFFVETEPGAYRKRVLEIKKQPGNIISPFKRFFVYDRTVYQSDIEFINSDLKNVINAAPSLK